MTAIDATCDELATLARANGLGGIELLVRADGRVTIRVLAPAGWSRSVAQADIVSGSTLPTPSSALASMVRT